MRLASLSGAGGCAPYGSECACAEGRGPQPRGGAGPGGRRARLVIGRTGRRASGLGSARAAAHPPRGGVRGKTTLGLRTGLRGARFRSPLPLGVAVPAAFQSTFLRGRGVGWGGDHLGNAPESTALAPSPWQSPLSPKQRLFLRRGRAGSRGARLVPCWIVNLSGCLCTRSREHPQLVLLSRPFILVRAHPCWDSHGFGQI